MNAFDHTMPEFWIQNAIEKIQENDFNSARPLAKMGYNLEKSNIEYGFIYMITLLDQNYSLSLFQMKNNLESLDKVIEELEILKNNNSMNQKQLDKFRELKLERYEFYFFVSDCEMRLNNGF
ncbi:hypothetical protein G6R40_02850 [Chryseobacterium sp. POL2]|uniref:hypothetical protein n=1 Tax=Chryseobacterium sp. POL2 TaxID=2713414 RepID=UPI0013E1BEEF|nr:hypothetical protein [Chryseobacterium sp. POL2]QIG88670.1 hypothetical protein G6R40_02850 [Chryseobacterium sp. POL2]